MVWINGVLLQEAKIKEGYSPRELAVLLNTAQKTIRVWERYPAKISPP